MKGFESGLAYLRKEALKAYLIQDSDNDDKLVERLARILRGDSPFESEEAEAEAEAARDRNAEKREDASDEDNPEKLELL